ncbi:glucosamine-6-phosphate deaminase [Cryobacterium sp. Y82]|uniref:glucosamine-6-phosphate deaminase n=1 Tax=Cryobacterium sp. Y82 TaxID=2045017 RepID=UPI000CE51B3A|nr:glucosamine-6-phosphate deaminase [Cryobacterium sp. Y82]
MKVYISNNIDALAAVAADEIEASLRRSAAPVLGLATGSSPLPVYRELARRVKLGLDLTEVTAFALDEYVGIPVEHPQCYAQVIRREAQIPLGLDAARVFVPNGRATDLSEACVEYEKAIASVGGIDVQILGIGSDGHIGFNEPSSSLASRTRVVALTAETRRDNARFFGSADEVPTTCVTQGIGTIRESGSIVLIAQGRTKSAAVAAMVEGPVSAVCPASALQLHPKVTILLDEQAAVELRFADYYRASYTVAELVQDDS